MAEGQPSKKQRVEEAAEGAEGAEGEAWEGDEAAYVDANVLQALVDKQEELEKLNDEQSERLAALEREFSTKRRPVYTDRAAIIAQVPKFWQRALVSHPQIHTMVTDDDVEVLGYVSELDVEDFPDMQSGYKITLHFAPGNPFFPEPKLVKEFYITEDGGIHVKGNVPTWNPGMGPSENQTDEEGQFRDYRLMLWFVEDEVLESGAHDPLADIVKEEIWPNPVPFYHGEMDGLLEGEEEDPSGEAPSMSAGEGEEFPEVYDEEADPGEGEGSGGGQ